MSGAIQGAMMPNPRRSPRPPQESVKVRSMLAMDGDIETVRTAELRVRWLIRSGKTSSILEFRTGWMDARRIESSDAFKIHWDPDMNFEISSSHDGFHLAHNDIYNSTGIYIHNAESIRSAAASIFHEIAHDYPDHRYQWFKSEGYTEPSYIKSERPGNWQQIQNNVHIQIESAVNRAITIYDKYYSD